MDTIVSDVIGNMMASALYEIARHTVSRIKHSRTNISKTEVQEFIANKLKTDERYLILSESGICEEYINSPKFMDTIDNYVMYIVTGRTEKVLQDTKIKTRSHYTINEEDLIVYLSDNLMEHYTRSKVLTKPPLGLVRDFFRSFIRISNDYVFFQLKKEDLPSTYFINRALLSLEDMMFTKMDEFAHIITKSMQIENIDDIDRFKESKDKYTTLIRDNNKTAHIYLLDRFNLDLFYVPPFLSCKDQMEIQFAQHHFSLFESATRAPDELFDDWKYIFDTSNIVYITGGAGYGKSLFLKNIINNYSKLNILDAENYLIIYGELKMFYNKDSSLPLSVIEFLQNSMKKETLLDDKTLSPEFIQNYLTNGRCIILLDALDEVEKGIRGDIHSKIINFMKNQNPNNKVCITSRSRGFLPEKDVQVYELKPLDATQINEYVDRIINLRKFDPNDREAFLKQTEKLIRKGFLNSFLVLSLLLNIYKSERDLPENKLELYQKCFEYIAIRRERRITSEHYDWKLFAVLMKENTFAELANLCLPNNHEVHKNEIISRLTAIYKAKYKSENEAQYAIEDFLRFCSDRTELFVPASNEDCYKFFHRSFFEYFYSQYLFTRLDSAEGVFNAVTQFDVDSEVFELTLSLYKQKNEEKYQAILEYTLGVMQNQKIDTKIRIAAINIFILGLQVIDDELYKKSFISFVTNNSTFITENIKLIHNQDIFTAMIRSKEEYAQSILKAYYDRSRFETVNSFLLSFEKNKKRIEQLLERGGLLDSFTKNVLQNNQFDLNKPLFLPEYFFLSVFFDAYSVRTILKNLNTAYIKKVCRACDVSKKRENALQQKYVSYSKVDIGYRKKIESFMFKNIENESNT